jgi:hypothetical protein
MLKRLAIAMNPTDLPGDFRKLLKKFLIGPERQNKSYRFDANPKYQQIAYTFPVHYAPDFFNELKQYLLSTGFKANTYDSFIKKAGMLGGMLGGEDLMVVYATNNEGTQVTLVLTVGPQN